MAKYYVVWKGRQTGIYTSWQECRLQVEGFSNAKHKSFSNLQEAQQAFNDGYQYYIANQNLSKDSAQKTFSLQTTKSNLPYTEYLCVDAACNMQTKEMEYRGVHYPSMKVIFHKKGFQEATNNIGEFLAIVHALTLLFKENNPIPIFSDSQVALSWVKQKKCKTTQKVTEKNAFLFELIRRAEKWLQNYTYTNPLLKWETDQWGENPADFGRK